MKNLLLIIFTFFNTLIYCQTNINTNDKLIPFAESNSFNEIKYGYRNLKNYIIVKPIFDFAENMIQNYSIVGLYIDDSIRYAILDVNGVLVTPFSIKSYNRINPNQNIFDININEQIFNDLDLNELVLDPERFGIDKGDIFNPEIVDIEWEKAASNIKTENKDLFAPKSEFETTNNYEIRITKQSELLISKKQEFTATFLKNKLLQIDELKKNKKNSIAASLVAITLNKFNLGSYNADNQTFELILNGVKYILYVPLNEAELFKQYISSSEIKGYEILKNDLITKKLVNLKILNVSTGGYYDFGEHINLDELAAIPSNSNTQDFSIGTPPSISMVVDFIDDNKNNILEFEENAILKITLNNNGGGVGKNLFLKTSIDNEQGIQFTKSIFIGNLLPNSQKSLSLNLFGDINLTTEKKLITLTTQELNGFNSTPVNIEIQTKEFITPTLNLENFKIENNKTKLSKIEPTDLFKLIYRVTNTSKGTAKNINFNLELPKNLFLTDKNKNILIEEIKPGGFIDLTYDIISNNLVNTEEEIKLKFSNKYLDKIISNKINFEKNKQNNDVIVYKNKSDEDIINIVPDFNIDIENNIPKPIKINDSAIAIVLGIESYKNLNSVKFAERDAIFVKEYFKQAFGIPESNIYFRLNQNVTQGEINKIFEGWLQNRVTPNTTLYVYFAGHGASSTANTNDNFLVPYDADPNYLDVTSYSMNKLYDNLAKLSTNKIVVFLDACFSGLDRDNNLLNQNVRGLGIKQNAITLPKKINLFSSSSSDQGSNSWNDKKHGLFTYFLLKGLQGEADTNKNTQITYEELSIYIINNVNKQALKLDRVQTPQTVLNNNLKIVY